MVNRIAPRLTKPATITLAGEEVARNTKPYPAHLAPAHRKMDVSALAEWQIRVIESALHDKNPTFVTGPAGTGKDYLGEWLASFLNRPLVCLSIKPGVDPNEWIGGTELKAEDGVCVSKPFEGFLASAVNPSNEVAPIVILSDFDRASPSAVEVFRQAFETDPARRYFSHPTTSELIPIHPDTVWILTGNSHADGDGGRGMITAAMDASIRNRLPSVRAELPTEAWEVRVMGEAYPDADPELIALAVKAMRSLRRVVVEQSLQVEVSLRTSHQVIKVAIRRHRNGAPIPEAVYQGCRLLIDHLGEEDNRSALRGALDPLLGVGARKD